MAALSVALIAGVSVVLIVTQDGSTSLFGGSTHDPGSHRDNVHLEELRDSCADGDLGSCDELYYASPIGSDDERFGSTCGEREAETDGGCEMPYG